MSSDAPMLFQVFVSGGLSLRCLAKSTLQAAAVHASSDAPMLVLCLAGYHRDASQTSSPSTLQAAADTVAALPPCCRFRVARAGPTRESPGGYPGRCPDSDSDSFAVESARRERWRQGRRGADRPVAVKALAGLARPLGRERPARVRACVRACARACACVRACVRACVTRPPAGPRM